MKKIFTTALIGTFLGWFTVPASALDDGPYIGASIGQASFQDKDLDEIDLDDDHSAWKVFGGARWGILAIEGGYVDFGDANETSGGQQVSADISGLDAFGMLSLPIGPIDLFGKVGGIYWDSDTKLGNISDNDDGFNLAWGVGVAVRFGSASIRAEYEGFDVDVIDDLNMYSVGFAWTF